MRGLTDDRRHVAGSLGKSPRRADDDARVSSPSPVKRINVRVVAARCTRMIAKTALSCSASGRATSPRPGRQVRGPTRFWGSLCRRPARSSGGVKRGLWNSKARTEPMPRQTFMEMLASTGPDRPKTPMLSREERLTKFMPPVVVEMLERRRLMTLTVSFDAGTIQIDGTTGADFISVYVGTGADTLIHISDGGGGSYPSYDPNQVSLVKVLAGGGNDSVYIDDDGPAVDAGNAVPETA